MDAHAAVGAAHRVYERRRTSSGRRRSRARPLVPVVADGQIWITSLDRDPASPRKKSRLDSRPPLRSASWPAVSRSKSSRCRSTTGRSYASRRSCSTWPRPGADPLAQQLRLADLRARLGQGLCCFGTFGVACLDMATGDVLWKNNELHCDHQNSPGSSPVLWKDKLIVTPTSATSSSSPTPTTLRSRARSRLERTPRSGKMKSNTARLRSVQHPSICRAERPAGARLAGRDWVYGYDPATGNELWKTHYGVLGFSTTPKPVTYRIRRTSARAT